jgi:hypothetical protein
MLTPEFLSPSAGLATNAQTTLEVVISPSESQSLIQRDDWKPPANWALVKRKIKK